MVSAIREYNMSRQPHNEILFRIADCGEISRPHRFKHLYRSPEWVERTHMSIVASSVLGRDDNEDRIRAMRAKYEKPSNEASQSDVRERLPCSQKIKSKKQALTKEDFPHLRQQWHDEFADIVNGTQNQLPPWREVNHEIHLVDDNKRYKYFTPHCPNSLQTNSMQK